MRGVLYTATVFVVVVLLAAGLERGQLVHTNMLTQEAVSLDDYIDGTVSRPFAYRVLLPKAMRAINALTPASAAVELDQWGSRIGWSGPQHKYPRDIVWLAVLQFASLIGYAIVGAMLFTALRGGETSRGDWLIAPLLLLVLVPIVYKGLGHLYDFTGLFLTAWLMWAMARGRHILYLVLFAIGCLNKETTLLMSFAYAAVFFGRMPFHRYVAMLAAQFAVFVAIYVPIRVAYGDNPGTGLQVHWKEQWPYYASHLHNGYVLAAFLIAVLVLLFLITFRWNEKPDLLRRASIMIVPHMALFFYGAAPGEVRNLYEILPLISMLMLFSVMSMGMKSFYGRAPELKP
jgi:hypothetical protein